MLFSFVQELTNDRSQSPNYFSVLSQTLFSRFAQFQCNKSQVNHFFHHSPVAQSCSFRLAKI